MGFEADVRAACLTTLGAYASANSVALNATPGRPKVISLPQAFVDRISEEVGHVVSPNLQRTVTAEVVLMHGLFDSGEAVDQRDAFVDGYITYLRTNRDSILTGTFGVVGIEDDPVYVPDWMDRAAQRPYFATRITLEAYMGE